MARSGVKFGPVRPMLRGGGQGERRAPGQHQRFSDWNVDFLLLTTPPQHAADNPVVERNPGRLRQWLGELPIMDVVETVRLLHAAITPFNELSLPDGERLKLLEVYRQGLEEIFLLYDEQRIHLLPLPARQRQALADDIMGIYLELANGYKILVRNGFDEGDDPGHDGFLLQAVYRAMELIALALLYARRTDRPLPKLAWVEMHQLYAFCESHDALRRRVKVARHESAVPTVERIYTQSLLLAVMDTRQQTGAELMELFMLLETHASHCDISEAPLEKAEAGRFVIDLMADEPPRPFTAGRETMMPRTLDITPVRSEIEACLSRHRAGDAPLPAADIRPLRMLAGLLGSHWGRQGPRSSVRRFVKVALGQKALAYFLGDPERLKHACNAEVHGGIEVLSLDSEEEVRYLLGDWQMLDQSDTGCLLVGRVGSSDEKPVVGSLLGVVGFLPTPGTQRLSIGIVRWQGEISEGRTKLGVEIIEGAAQPILFGSTAQDLERAPELGFYFPRNTDEGRPASLLLPRRNGEESLYVRVQGKAFEVMTAAVVREAEEFVQYRFRVQV